MPDPTNKMFTFYRWPSPARGEFARPFGGITEVLRQYSRFLPIFGWVEKGREREAELVVGHLGTKSERLDVFHLHGLMPTATQTTSSQDFGVNALIIDNIRRARRVICVSDWVADILRRDMHMSPDVVGHGFDWEIWQEITPTVLDDPRPKVLWNKTRDRGVCDPTPVIELARRLPDISFLTTFLPKGIHQAPPNVTVTGLVSHWDAWSLIKAVDVYLGTTKETFGVGALEALASRVPVIGFQHGATPGVVGDLGLFVQPGDYDGLAEKLKEALDRKEELGELGLQHVKDHFTWAGVVRRVAAIYKEAVLGLEPTSPRVTVVIPCYNKVQFVAHAIRSVLRQSFTDWELLVVDDGSTDNSVEEIEQVIAEEPKARLIRHEHNRGVAHARNTGIAAGSGEFVWCLDADDGADPKYLEALVAGLEEDRRLGITYTALRVMNDEGKLRNKVHTWPHQYDPKKGPKGNQIPTSCLFRRLWWARTGGPRQRYAPHGAGQEDADLWLRILAYGGGAKMVSKKGLFHYRFHKDQVTRIHRSDWDKNTYFQWHPFVQDGEHPLASQLDVPPNGSWLVRNYDQPKVSIIVPVGPGHEDLLLNALDSVEAQTYRYWELIVVNDTGQELDLVAWPFVKLIDTAEAGMGPGHARNLGTEASSAPLVVYLDADDILQPTFLEDTLRLWLEVGGWIYTDFFHVKQDGTHGVWQAKEWDLERLWTKGMAAVTCLYPYQAWKDVGGFDTEIAHEDWEFHIKLAIAGWCGTRLAKPLITYRHDTGMRRKENIAVKGFKQVKRRYTKESLQVCNCRKGGGVRRRKTRRAAPPASSRDKVQRISLAALDPAKLPARSDNNYKLMMYVGKSETDLMFRGKTGKVYIFSAQRRLAWIAPQDIHKLARKSVLRLIKLEDLEAARVPELQLPAKGAQMEISHESINV